MNEFVCNGCAITNELRRVGSRAAALAESAFREVNSRKARNITIFAPSHGTHFCAKILFACGEKNGNAKALQANLFSMLIKIPKPDFIVLYNGTEQCPDEFEMKLSDAFMEAPEIPELLELTVKGYNVNDGHNPEILRRSRSLGDYARFVAQIRKNQELGMTLSEAITAAIRRCIDDGVMADYLKKQSSEVENMLMTEFNIDVAKEVWMDEAREEGEARGKLATALAMISDGVSIEKASKYSGIPTDKILRRIKASGVNQPLPQ